MGSPSDSRLLPMSDISGPRSILRFLHSQLHWLQIHAGWAPRGQIDELIFAPRVSGLQCMVAFQVQGAAWVLGGTSRVLGTGREGVGGGGLIQGGHRYRHCCAPYLAQSFCAMQLLLLYKRWDCRVLCTEGQLEWKQHCPKPTTHRARPARSRIFSSEFFIFNQICHLFLATPAAPRFTPMSRWMVHSFGPAQLRGLRACSIVLGSIAQIDSCKYVKISDCQFIFHLTLHLAQVRPKCV